MSFLRTYKLTAVAQPTGFIGSNPQFFERLDNGIEITGHRIRFDVSKNLGKEPNKAEIKISNLASTTRSFLEHKPLRITLQAGYAGNNRLVLTGDVTRAWTEREDGTEIVTNLQVHDGLRAFAHARMSKSYRPPITVLRVLTDAAESMGLQLPDDLHQNAELKQALADGISTHGPTREILTRLLAPYGLHWSVQNGHLQVLADEQVSAGEAYLISQATGMLEHPERKEPEKPGSPVEVNFKHELYPELDPGKLVQLDSEFIKGNLKLIETKHTGDSRDGDWVTACTGRPQ